MAFDIKKNILQNNENNVVQKLAGNIDVTPYDEIMRIPYENLIMDEYKTYDIDKEEVEDIAENIALIGLEQNLVVKQTDDPSKYIVVTGHKRLSGIRYIFENNLEISDKVKKNISSPHCVVIPKDETELVTKLRMHSTNVTQRKKFTIEEMEDYLNVVQEARASGTKINGKEVKGSSRSILQKQYGFTDGTAKRYLKIIKEADEEMKKKVNEGEWSVNYAYEILQGKIVPETANGDKDSEERKKSKEEKEYELHDFRKDLVRNYKNIKKTCNKANNLQFPKEYITSVKEGMRELNNKYYEFLRLLESIDEE